MSHHWEDLLQHQRQHMLREPELSSVREGALRDPTGCARLECPGGRESRACHLPTVPYRSQPSSGPPGKLPRHVSGEEQRPGAASTGGPSSGRPPTELSGKLRLPMEKSASLEMDGDPTLLDPFREKKRQQWPPTY